MSNMQLFRKQNNTGMLKTRLSEGSEINGKPVKAGSYVIRPGNTVKCIPSELGVMGGRQFDALSPAPAQAAVANPPKRPTATLELRKQEKGSKWDVINPLNPTNPLNPEGLTKTKAQALLAQLLDQPEGGDDDLTGLGWDALVDVLEREGGTVPDEAQDEADLIEAIKANRE